MLSIGQVVYSKNGRDAGRCFLVAGLVTGAEGEYLLLVDGERRTLDKYKKKKLKHVQKTNTVLPDMAERLRSADRGLLDANIRKALLPYQRARKVPV